MKFNIKIYIPVTTLGLSLLLSGCGDSFLEKSPQITLLPEIYRK